MKAAAASVMKLADALRPRSGRRAEGGHEVWMATEERVGAKSTVLFLPDQYGVPHYTDGGYRYTDKVWFDGEKCSVAEVMREIHRRGWEIGLHASWESGEHLEELKRQKEQVESALDAEIVSIRHHHLHFDIRRTPLLQWEAGFRYDSSLGFNDNIGFRNGTSHPWFLPGPNAGRDSSVIELPLVIQDKGLLESLCLGVEECALEWTELLAERVRSVGGVLTLLWHPRILQEHGGAEQYERTLKLLERKGAWFGTMAMIGAFWRNRLLDQDP